VENSKFKVRISIKCSRTKNAPGKRPSRNTPKKEVSSFQHNSFHFTYGYVPKRIDLAKFTTEGTLRHLCVFLSRWKK
jgi:hypothetical protein